MAWVLTDTIPIPFQENWKMMISKVDMKQISNYKVKTSFILLITFFFFFLLSYIFSLLVLKHYEPMIWLLLVTLRDLAEVECSLVCEARIIIAFPLLTSSYTYCYHYYANTQQTALNSAISWSPFRITMQIP